MRTPSPALGTMLLLAGAGAAGFAVATLPATLYKWVDEQGNVTYQDRPPPPGQAYEERVIAEPPAAAAAPAAAPVTLYSIADCAACDLVRLYLGRHGIPFVEKDAQSDPAVQAELLERSGGFEVPTLMVGDRALVGFRVDLVAGALVDGGYRPLLEGDAGEAGAGQESGGGGSATSDQAGRQRTQSGTTP